MIERRSQERVIDLEIYTDGSLKKSARNMTFGGWGFIAVQDSKEVYEASGSEYNTTNQRMELVAISKALEYASAVRRPSTRVAIYSDSAYAINCYLQNWYIKWQSNGWVNSKGEDVANRDLWQQIIPYFDNFWYTFIKVKGHDKSFWNNKCDELVQKEADKLKHTWRGLSNG